jgi:tRNA (cmo5U34)-methyltransferase
MEPREIAHDRFPMGDGISAWNSAIGSWNFQDPAVANNFDAHVRKSVPYYEDIRSLVLQISDWYVGPNSRVLDLGCSTGTLIKDMGDRHADKNVSFIGIDKSPEMLEKAKELVGTSIQLEPMRLDIASSDLPLSFFNLVLSIFTIQFLPRELRNCTLRKIHRSLQTKGALLLAEKIEDPSGSANDIYNQLHWDYKAQKGLSPTEILNKAKSLRGVLNPSTLEDTMSALKEAGFSDIAIAFKWCNFVLILAIK